MQAGLSFVGTLTGGAFGLPTENVSIVLTGIGSELQMRVTDYGRGVSHLVQTGGSGLASVVSSLTHTPADRVTANVAGAPGSLLDVVIADAGLAADLGQSSADLSFLAPGDDYSQSAMVLRASIGGQDLMFVAGREGAGLTAFSLNGSGAIVDSVLTADTDTSYGAGISDMATLAIGGTSYLYVASALEHGVSGYQVAATGALSEVDSFGMLQGLPVNTVTALEVAGTGGGHFLVVGAAGSSSLSVLEVAADGSLSATDHVIDGLTTRFADLGQMDVATIGGRSYVLAGGSDGGLSLFVLSAEGRLVLLDTIVDRNGQALDNLSALEMSVRGQGLDVFTMSGSEAGLSQFRIELNNLGVVQSVASGVLNGTAGDDMLSLGGGGGSLNGQGGDDILSDGAGADTLSGGAGADIFVLAADGRQDVITDIAVGQDRLDLSAWNMLRNVGQLEVVTTGDGAQISYGDEVLVLHSADGQPLDAADIAALLPSMESHYAITRTTAGGGGGGGGDQPLFLEGTSGNDTLTGQALNDWLDGKEGDDTLYGGDGDDSLLGRGGNDLIYGGGGNDNIAASDGDDEVHGGPGNDAMGGGYGNDRMFGEDGNDVIGSGSGRDYIDAGNGDDVASGGWGYDEVHGGAGGDTLAGSYDADRVYGEDGDDSLGGGTGDDYLDAGAGNDLIGAGADNDELHGGTGNDFLGGGAGNDLLYGEDGSDKLNGGSGDDTLYGGAGADQFVFTQMTSGERDVIADFQDGIDTIRMHGIASGTQQQRFDALSISAVSGGVDISYGGHVIHVDGAAVSDFSTADFILL